MRKKHYNNDYKSPATKRWIRFAKRALGFMSSSFLWVGSALGIFMFLAAWNLFQSDFTVHMVKAIQKHAHDTGRLARKNRVDWWLVNGQYSQEAERNATAREWVKKFSKLCNLKVVVKNRQNIPKSGKLVVIANHDNLIAGNFLASIIDEARGGDVTKVLSVNDFLKLVNIAAVSDYTATLLPGAEEKINTHLQSTNPLVIFPKTGDYYTAKQDKKLSTFRFMDGFLRFAIQNESDILPVKIHLDYPWWWRVLWFIVPLDLGKAILNAYVFYIYQNTTLHITIGDVIPYSKIKQDADKSYMKRGKTRYPDHVLQKYERAIM